MNRFLQIIIFLLSVFSSRGQSIIANYVNNGGFEQYTIASIYKVPLYWSATDSSKVFGQLFVYPQTAPLNQYTYQWPRHGNSELATGLYSNFTSNNRGYPRNRLKQYLQQGKTYCVTFYVNLSNQSTYGIDAMGAYFGGSSLDTITHCNDPITYLIPQVQNQPHNVITDTLNWVKVQGQYTANGSEKYLFLGNFKSDSATDTILVDTTYLPYKFADYLFDDVSVIEMNLSAYAGRDTIVSPGTPVFLGREPDFALDYGCTWYQWPNMSVPIYDKAGLWINPTVTTTYIVKQTLDCSSTKWDTVVVTVDPTVGYVSSSGVENDIRLFPNPADNFIELRSGADLSSVFNKIRIYNNLGQLIREENFKLRIDTEILPQGVYFLKLSSASGSVTKRIVISR